MQARVSAYAETVACRIFTRDQADATLVVRPEEPFGEPHCCSAPCLSLPYGCVTGKICDPAAIGKEFTLRIVISHSRWNKLDVVSGEILQINKNLLFVCIAIRIALLPIRTAGSHYECYGKRDLILSYFGLHLVKPVFHRGLQKRSEIAYQFDHRLKFRLRRTDINFAKANRPRMHV